MLKQSIICQHPLIHICTAVFVLCRLIPQLFYYSDNQLHSIPLSQARRQVEDLMYPFLSDYPSVCPTLVHGLAKSYDQTPNRHLTHTEHVIQSAVSRVVHTLVDMFSCSSSPHVKVGGLLIIKFFSPHDSYTFLTLEYSNPNLLLTTIAMEQV